VHPLIFGYIKVVFSVVSPERNSPTRFFASDFFHEWVSPEPLPWCLKAFLIWFQIRENIRDWLSAIVYSGESILPYCLVCRVVIPCIIYNGDLKMYELYAKTLTCCLIQTVNTPCIAFKFALTSRPGPAGQFNSSTGM
jgi:hypothetical protein